MAWRQRVSRLAAALLATAGPCGAAEGEDAGLRAFREADAVFFGQVGARNFDVPHQGGGAGPPITGVFDTPVAVERAWKGLPRETREVVFRAKHILAGGGAGAPTVLDPGRRYLIFAKRWPDPGDAGRYYEMRGVTRAFDSLERIPRATLAALDAGAREVEQAGRRADPPGTDRGALSRRVRLRLEGSSLADLLEFLGKETGLRYLASSEALRSARPVTVSGEKSVREILDEAAAQAGVSYDLAADGAIAIRGAAPTGVPEPAPPAGPALGRALEIRIGRLVTPGLDPSLFPRDVFKMFQGRPLGGMTLQGPVETLRVHAPDAWTPERPPGIQNLHYLYVNPDQGGLPDLAGGWLYVAALDCGTPDAAVRRLGELAREHPTTSVEWLAIGGWPALQRRYAEPEMTPSMHQPRPTGRTLDMCATEIAAGGVIVRLVGQIPAGAPATLYPTMMAVGRGVEFQNPGDPAGAAQRIQELRDGAARAAEGRDEPAAPQGPAERN